jgi:hypothetical protein
MPMKKKSDTFAAFLIFQAFAENHFNDTIKAIQDDEGGEFISNEFKAL